MQMDNLVKRLERNSGWRNERWQCVTDPALLTEAAARITELETALAEAGKQLRENAETLAQVPAAIAEARRQALEEAAKVAEDTTRNYSPGTFKGLRANIAQAIRALASDPLLDRQGK